MRRTDREITDFNKIVGIIDKCIICRIAFNDTEYPYILPVNFGYEIDGADIIIYFHGSSQGRKHELIIKNNKVSFEMDCSLEFLTQIGQENCTASMAYESVIGQGEVFAVPDENKEKALTVILNHHKIEVTQFNPVHLSNTKVYGIRCSNYSAKRRASR